MSATEGREWHLVVVGCPAIKKPDSVRMVRLGESVHVFFDGPPSSAEYSQIWDDVNQALINKMRWIQGKYSTAATHGVADRWFIYFAGHSADYFSPGERSGPGRNDFAFEIRILEKESTLESAMVAEGYEIAAVRVWGVHQENASNIFRILRTI